MRLSELIQESDIHPLMVSGADPVIRGTSLDSRLTEPGDLFFAIPGFRTSGEAFVPDAIRRGACAVIAGSPPPPKVDERIGWIQVDEPRRVAGLLSREYFGRPDEALSLVGITGTNGKTTVAHLVESIGKAAGRCCGRIGTIGCSIDGSERPLARTTPEAPDLYRLLAEMRDRDVDLVPMEVSSHALALFRVEGARFAAAAFLNLSPDHLDFHGGLEDYFEAKARLFEMLGPEQWAVLAADSPEGRVLAERTPGRVLTFGRSKDAQVRLSDEHCGLEGSSAILETPDGRLPLRTFLPGRFNLENVAAAAACAIALGLPPESIPAGVLALEGVPGRMQQVDCGQPFKVFVDFAHTPAALEGLLTWVREVSSERVLVVVGCGGARDREKRPIMGRVAAEGAHRIFLTSDNPRDEDPREILDRIMEGVASAGGTGRSRIIEDREAAIREAIGAAEPDDVVVIAGKGHETTQVIGEVVRPFDDREIARRCLREIGWKGGRGAEA